MIWMNEFDLHVSLFGFFNYSVVVMYSVKLCLSWVTMLVVVV